MKGTLQSAFLGAAEGVQASCWPSTPFSPPSEEPSGKEWLHKMVSFVTSGPRCFECRLHPSLSSRPFLSLLSYQAAERDNQNLEDKVRSLKTDIEESKYRQRHLKGELKNFLEVLDGKIDDLHDFRRGLSKLGTDN